MPPLRIGIIGAGATGERQAHAVAARPDLILVGVHDSDLERSRVVTDAWGGRIFDELTELVDEVDAVAVATPADTHDEIVGRALSAGRHVFVATPIAERLASAQRLRDAVLHSRELVVQVGHLDCFTPACRAMRAMIQNDRLLSATFRRIHPPDPADDEVDVVRDLLIQDLYLAIELFGDDIAMIDAFGANERGCRPNLVVVELLLDDGREVKLVASKVGEAALTTVDLELERRHLRADLRAGTILEQAYGGPLGDAVAHAVPDDDPLQAELEQFIDCVRHGRKPTVDACAGFNALVYLDAIEQVIARTRGTSALPVLAGL